jgi:hypothetical protein
MVFAALWWLSGCAASGEAGPRQATGTPAQLGRQAMAEPGRMARKKTCPDEIQDWGWRERTITEEELADMENCEPGLDRSVCARILSALNTKTEFLIREDIRNRKPLKVPNDFRAYRHWNPLPKHVAKLSAIPKMILVVKDIPYLGWYEQGHALGGSQVCLGRPGEETVEGVYRILEKEEDKYSRSYNNDFGQPAWMPYAMRIYGGVWIHAGCLTGPYCSHGCVILNMEIAENLFQWADSQTVVFVADSLEGLDQLIRKKSTL